MRVLKCDLCGEVVFESRNLIQIDDDYRINDKMWSINDMCIPCKRKLIDEISRIEKEQSKDLAARLKEFMMDLVRETAGEVKKV